MQTILITGATGFLGSAIVARLQQASRQEGVKIRATGRSGEPPAPPVEFLPAELTERHCLASLCANVDCVVHAAGLAHQFRPDVDIRRRFQAINRDVAENIARAAANAGVRHFVLVSSMSVYGAHGRGPCRETDACRPADDYARSKFEGEQMVRRVAEESGMRLTILRPATIYGEGDPGNLARLISLIDRGRFVWIGDGRNRKSLIHRDDAAEACARAVGRRDGELVEVYNVTAPPCTMRDVVQVIADRLERRIAPLRIPAGLMLPTVAAAARLVPASKFLHRVQGTLHKWRRDDLLCAEKFNRQFAFETRVSLEEGLRREVDWYLPSRPGCALGRAA